MIISVTCIPLSGLVKPLVKPLFYWTCSNQFQNLVPGESGTWFARHRYQKPAPEKMEPIFSAGFCVIGITVAWPVCLEKAVETLWYMPVINRPSLMRPVLWLASFLLLLSLPPLLLTGFEFWCVILCSASGDVASKVVIEKRTESVMAFYKGSGDFYLGYITLKVLHSFLCCKTLLVWYDNFCSD